MDVTSKHLKLLFRYLKLGEGVKHGKIDSRQLIGTEVQTADYLICSLESCWDEFGYLVAPHENVSNISLGSLASH
jgi:hypothetical protein